jgi:hypothetical protein
MTTNFEGNEVKYSDEQLDQMYQDALNRMNELEFTEQQQEFIFADWPEWGEHLAWLLTATKKGIEDWIEAGK